MYIDKLYTKLFSDKNWDGIETLRAEVRSISQRLFAEMTHYTTSEGAKGIMKEGFKADGNLSAFRSDNDHIRNNESYDMNNMIDNIQKRERRLGNKKLTSKDPSILKYRFGNGIFYEYYPYNHGDPYNPHDVFPNGKTMKEIRETNPDKFDKDEGLITTVDTPSGRRRVTFPAGYKQISQIRGLNRGATKRPIYRVIFDTNNDENLEESHAYETKVPIKDVNQDSRKLEIPRGMYKGTKKVKRGYINDYNDFNPNDFNTEDAPTREAVEDIKKKSRFLNSGHGKK